MKICAAQTKSVKGDVYKNIENHKKIINMAVSNGADIIIFPELSLTGYEPALSKELAINQDDSRFNDFQKISDAKNIIIGAGMPTKSRLGIQISLIIFQPDKPRQIYSKQHLHEDEQPYFINGEGQVFLTLNNTKIAPAICYESLLPEHSENAFNSGAQIYIASVAKSTGGVEKAFKHFPEVARKYSMHVMMSNCVGQCDNFQSAGKTSVWNNKGELIGQLNGENEGILIFDVDSQETIEKKIAE